MVRSSSIAAALQGYGPVGDPFRSIGRDGDDENGLTESFKVLLKSSKESSNCFRASVIPDSRKPNP